MITDSNHACFTKMSGCGQQEVIFEDNPEKSSQLVMDNWLPQAMKIISKLPLLLS